MVQDVLNSDRTWPKTYECSDCARAPLARSGGDVGGGLRLFVTARAAFGRARVAAAGSNFGPDDSAGHIEPSRTVQHSADFDFHSEWRDHDCHDWFAGFPDSRHSATSRPAADAAACGNRALGYQRFSVCTVVLEAGCGRSVKAGDCARPGGQLISLSANADSGVCG